MKYVTPAIFIALNVALIVDQPLRAENSSNPSPPTVKLNNGKIVIERRKIDDRFEDTIVWRTDQGREHIVERLSGKSAGNPYWTIAGAFSAGDEIALIVGQANGSFEYWRYEISYDKWSLQAKAVLDAPIVLKAIEFTAIDQFKFLSKRNPPDFYTVTDKPRSGDKLYREVTKNGAKLETPGAYLSAEMTAPEPSQLQVGTPSAPRPSDSVNLPSSSKVSNPKSEQATHGQRPVTSWFWVAVMIAAAGGLLGLLFNRRK